jgi:hypothetical protein
MILRRSPRPFRYQDERWPERVEEMVAAAERVEESVAAAERVRA